MNIKKVVLIILVVVLLALCSSWAVVYQKYNNKENYVNKLRLCTNSIYSKLKNNGLDIDKDSLDAIDDVRVTIIDLSEHIVYSNADNAYDDNILITSLYQDHYYIESNPTAYKLSFPIYDDGIVIGFVIFEKIFSSEENYRRVLVWLEIIIIIIVLIMIIWLFYMIFSKQTYMILPLKDGLEDLANGILKEIAIPQNAVYYDLYVSYNKLVEEIAYINKQNLLQEMQRKKFITMISHEIKTPLSAITAYSEALIKGVAKDKKTEKEYIQVIYDRTKNCQNKWIISLNTLRMILMCSNIILKSVIQIN